MYNTKMLNISLTSVLSLSCFLLILYWLNIKPAYEIKVRTAPAASGALESLSKQKVNIKGSFTAFSGTPSLLKNTWGGFRGRDYNNINSEQIGLTSNLPSKDIPVLWTKKLGEGYAGAAIANGRVYVLDYNKETQSDSLRCISFDTGEDIWKREYRIPIKRNHGISRTVPAVNDKYVVTIGPKCQVMCVDAVSGEYKWGMDLTTRYETKVPLWYTGQCPLIDGSTAVIAPAGKALMIAVDLETGKVLWETPNPDNLNMSHSSIIPMTLLGQKIYVYCAIGAITGIKADGDDAGRILFKSAKWNHSVISPSPVKIGGNKIFVTAGYGNGSMMFEVFKKDGVFELKEVFTLNKEVFACEQHTPIFYKNHLFTIMPNDAGELNRQLVCMDTNGKMVWNSGKDNRFGLGPFIIADDKIFILDDNGVLTIAEAGIRNFNKLSQSKVLNGRESWAPIAIAGGRIILRDFEEMICIDLKN